MPQVDPELFDRGQFQAELALKSSPIAAFKKAIRQFREVLDNRFNSGRDIRRLIEDRAWCVDQILQQAWQRFDWETTPDIALVAVGGYGAANSYLDVDLLILLDSEDQGEPPSRSKASSHLLYGHRPEVGQSVRSVQQCAEEARADLTVITTLMECHLQASTACASVCAGLRQRARNGRAKGVLPGQTPRSVAPPHAKYTTTPSTTRAPTSGLPGGRDESKTILW